MKGMDTVPLPEEQVTSSEEISSKNSIREIT
jgi:hypothetical protein